MFYRIWMPVPGSVNGRALVDPQFPEDLAVAEYRVVTWHEGPEGETLDKVYEAHQNGIEQFTGVASRNQPGVRSLSVGDVVQTTEDGVFHMVDNFGWKTVLCYREAGTREGCVKFRAVGLLDEIRAATGREP